MPNKYLVGKDNYLYGPLTIENPDSNDYQVALKGVSGTKLDQPGFHKAWVKFNVHLAGLPKTTIRHEGLQDGMIVEEGKDYYISLDEESKKGGTPTFIAIAGKKPDNPNPITTSPVALPVSEQGEKEEKPHTNKFEDWEKWGNEQTASTPAGKEEIYESNPNYKKFEDDFRKWWKEHYGKSFPYSASEFAYNYFQKPHPSSQSEQAGENRVVGKIFELTTTDESPEKDGWYMTKWTGVPAFTEKEFINGEWDTRFFNTGLMTHWLKPLALWQAASQKKGVRESKEDIVGKIKLVQEELANVTEEEKEAYIKALLTETSKIFLAVFIGLKLKTHIEGMIIEENTGGEFVLSFREVQSHLKWNELMNKEPLSTAPDTVQGQEELWDAVHWEILSGLTDLYSVEKIVNGLKSKFTLTKNS